MEQIELSNAVVGTEELNYRTNLRLSRPRHSGNELRGGLRSRVGRCVTARQRAVLFKRTRLRRVHGFTRLVVLLMGVAERRKQQRTMRVDIGTNYDLPQTPEQGHCLREARFPFDEVPSPPPPSLFFPEAVLSNNNNNRSKHAQYRGARWLYRTASLRDTMPKSNYHTMYCCPPTLYSWSRLLQWFSLLGNASSRGRGKREKRTLAIGSHWEDNCQDEALRGAMNSRLSSHCGH